MAGKLILSLNGVVMQEYPLNEERITIGRKAHNDIVIDNLAVSGEHAAIITLMNDSFLEDLDSTNGVSVNGEPTKKHFLQNNDLIEIGKYKLKYLNDQPSQLSPAEFEKTMVLRAPLTPPRTTNNDEAGDVTGKYKPVGSAKPPSTPVAPIPAMAPAAPVAPTAPIPAVAPAAPVAPPKPASPPPSSQGAGAAKPAAAQHGAAVIQILNGPNAGKELELVKNLTTLGKPGVQVAVLTHRPHGYFITYVEGDKYPMINGKPLDDQPRQLAEHDIIELAGIKMEFYFKN